MPARAGRVDAEIARLTEVIERLPAPHEEQLARAEPMPGRGRRAAQDAIAETGTGISRSPRTRAPGLTGGPHPPDNQPGQRNGRAKPSKGNRYLAGLPGETAVAAGKTQTREGARCRRIARRQGKAKAQAAPGQHPAEGSTTPSCPAPARATRTPARGDVPAARRELTNAQRLRSLMTYALPPWAVQARIQLTRVHLALNDLAGARTLMREIDELLRRRPDLGSLADEAKGLRSRLSTERGCHLTGASSLTAAELRLVPLLASQMPVPEVAAELFLSPHTVRAELKSMYRKLSVTSRSQAVIRSRELGLLEG
jgi:DNA-binding CsgD family transcriptional regulator